MSSLSILYLVLPFPLAFILHDAEEVMVQHRWMLAHRESLVKTFPKMKPLIEHLCGLNTKAFAIAAFEELAVLLLATGYVLADGIYSMQIWAALFMAFSIHLLVHIGQAIAVRGYVPGIVSTVLLLPYSFSGMQSIRNAMSGLELITWGVVGVIIMVVNLRFAHRLGLKIGKQIY